MYIEDAFRPFWAKGLNNITINNSKGLSEWLRGAKDYQIYLPVSKSEFSINVHDRSLFLAPISQDCNRFSTSSLESIIKTDDLIILPRTASWILIKQYYAAFYSAHLITRMLGTSLTQLDAQAINSIKKVADLFGNLNDVEIENGYYQVDYLSGNRIDFKKVKINQDGGSHVALWKLFGEKLSEITLNMLQSHSSSALQDIAIKIDELVSNLDYVGSNNHSWLARIRNDLNYKHMHGVWHPYYLPQNQLELIKRNYALWKFNIMNIELKNHTGKEMMRFSNTCQFIIGLGNSICKDMVNRCSIGKSFLNSGYKRIVGFA